MILKMLVKEEKKGYEFAPREAVSVYCEEYGIEQTEILEAIFSNKNKAEMYIDGIIQKMQPVGSSCEKRVECIESYARSILTPLYND